jgi:hypothetical protein
MRRIFTVVTLLLSLSIGQEALLACGDKFFLVGRGDRFSRAYASLHPGKVLLYTAGTSDISKGLGDVRLHKWITNAGHQVLLATNHAELEQLLRSESVDVILTDLVQALDLLPQVAAAPSQPTLVPIEGKGAAAHSAVRDQFTTRLKSTDKVNRFLGGIEEVMKTRLRSDRSRG